MVKSIAIAYQWQLLERQSMMLFRWFMSETEIPTPPNTNAMQIKHLVPIFE